MILGFTLLMLLVGQAVLTWQSRRAGRRAEGVASIVAET